MDLAGNFSGWAEELQLALPTKAEAEASIAQAEAERQAEIDAAKPPPKERLGLFEDHNTGCSVGRARPAARPHAAMLVALLGAGLVFGARRRRAHD
jgi:MYXO-CTERM domain-containing protein